MEVNEYGNLNNIINFIPSNPTHFREGIPMPSNNARSTNSFDRRGAPAVTPQNPKYQTAASSLPQQQQQQPPQRQIYMSAQGVNDSNDYDYSSEMTYTPTNQTFPNTFVPQPTNSNPNNELIRGTMNQNNPNPTMNASIIP
eukprot:Pgem_evm1s14467